MDTLSMEAAAAIEALRAGVVNPYVVKHATYGQESRLQRLCGQIEIMKKNGSVQVLVGGYGTGKSHLSELLAGTLEQRGFAVARLEMGASHGRAENPRSVVSAVEQSLTFSVDGRSFRGVGDLAMALRAIGPDGWYFTKEEGLIQNIYQRLPGRTKFLARFDVLRRGIPQFWGSIGANYLPNLSLTLDVPHSMSATNKAVAKLNWLAHQLRKIEVHGLVLILDEAERAEWAVNSYRAERASDLMMGLALTAGNLDTSGLRHYRYVQSNVYRPYNPSYMHVVFAFTHGGGLCQQICQKTGTTPEQLESLGDLEKIGIQRRMLALYAMAYGSKHATLDTRDQTKVWMNTTSDDIRSFIRGLIAALDHRRLREG